MRKQNWSRTDIAQELLREVQTELDRQRQLLPSRIPALEQELAEIQSQKRGWTMSLGKENLPAATRSAIEISLAEAADHENAVLAALDRERAVQEGTSLTATLEHVTAALDRLDRLMEGENATLANVELALHIDRIDCFPDGKVQIRTSKLGALYDATALLKEEEPGPSVSGSSSRPATDFKRPRQRQLTRRDTRAADPADAAIRHLAETATDPRRFAGLSDQWFWVDEFEIPKRQPWPVAHAAEVLAFMEQNANCSTTALMEHFKKSRPTILAAVRIAAKSRLHDAATKVVDSES